MINLNHIPIYSVYGAEDEILFVGTRQEIADYFEVCTSNVCKWITGKTKKYKCYLVGYSDDDLEDEL